MLLGLHQSRRAGIHRVVRHTLSFLFTGLLFVSLARGDQVSSPGYEVIKVNHEFINQKGFTQDVIGDLVNRAKYQQELQSSGAYKGIRFFIHWKSPSDDSRNIVVKVEARGLDADSGRETTEVLTKSYLDSQTASGWATLDLTNDTFKKFGKLMAWRVSLWRGSEMKTSRVSFTWEDSYSNFQASNQTSNSPNRGL
jgi:hypothetical protein